MIINRGFSISAALIAMLLSTTVVGQDYKASLLIPFNDHGKWGYSDTLGNLKVEPQFESATFFQEMNDFACAYVGRAGTKVCYVSNKGLVAPAGCYAENSFYDRAMIDHSLSIIQKDGKYGLFNYEKQKVVVNPEHGKTAINSSAQFIYFYSKKEDGKAGEMTIFSYDMLTQKTKKLKYVELRIQYSADRAEGEDFYFFRDDKNQWFMHARAGWMNMAETDIEEEQKSNDDSNIRVAIPLPPPPMRFGPVEPMSTFSVRGATLYSSIAYSRRGNYQVMWKNNLFGLYANSEEILPFRFDFIDIDFMNGFFYLMKDNHFGVYLPGTTYSLIEPKYDLIQLEERLRVNDRWQFVIFKAIVDGNDGYVGENGVEFFKLD